MTSSSKRILNHNTKNIHPPNLQKRVKLDVLTPTRRLHGKKQKRVPHVIITLLPNSLSLLSLSPCSRSSSSSLSVSPLSSHFSPGWWTGRANRRVSSEEKGGGRKGGRQERERFRPASPSSSNGREEGRHGAVSEVE